MSAVAPEMLARLDALQIRYIDSLDSKDMAGWLDTFDEKGSYICTVAENEERDLPIALMMDDCRERLEDRVTFITKVWAGTFQDYRTRHFVQRTRCEARPDASFEMTTSFSVLYTDESGSTQVLAAGCYQDHVILDSEEPRFRAKKAVMDTSVSARYLVYPL